MCQHCYEAFHQCPFHPGSYKQPSYGGHHRTHHHHHVVPKPHTTFFVVKLRKWSEPSYIWAEQDRNLVTFLSVCFAIHSSTWQRMKLLSALSWSCIHTAAYKKCSSWLHCLQDLAFHIATYVSEAEALLSFISMSCMTPSQCQCCSLFIALPSLHAPLPYELLAARLDGISTLLHYRRSANYCLFKLVL